MTDIKPLAPEALEAGLDDICQSPRDGGVVVMIVRRPQTGERELLAEGQLDVTEGLVGDNWRTRGSSRNFNPQAGHKQKGRRPALVISPAAYNEKVGLAIFCPITSQVKGYPFEVKIPPGLRVTGVVLSDQVKSLDWQVRQAELICTMPETTVKGVLHKLAALINW